MHRIMTRVKLTKAERILIILLLTSFFQEISAGLNDPYKILGIGKYATNQEIRRAYKQLAKEWHPDKSSHPEAESKFVEIKQAYELLNDVDRRRIFDHHGITNEDSHFFKKQHDYSPYRRFGSEPFEEFFGQRFNFDQDISIYHKLTVTAKYFEQTIMSKSVNIPHILMFYSDWCFRCTRLVGALKKLIDNLEPLGIQFATINAAHEQSLIRKVGVDDIPSLILVLNGHSFVYRESSFTVQKIVGNIINSKKKAQT